MVRERASTCSSLSDSSRSGHACSSSTTSSDATSSSSPSSSSSSSSSDSSSSISGPDARLSSHKRRHSRSNFSRSNHGSRREQIRRQHREGHSSCKNNKSSKKRRKQCYDTEPNGKSDRKRHRKKEKRKVTNKHSQSATKDPFTHKKRNHKLHDSIDDTNSKERRNNLLEVAMNAHEQQKALIRHNAELAKARLASGELQRAREEQIKMHQLYGTVDWRAKKKLRTEKKILEKTVAAGKKLASLEEREYARMDAFRIALGLPTAEAQRQAEWRAEATQALLELETGAKEAGSNRCKKPKQGLIGPMLPP